MKKDRFFINRQEGILVVFEGISGCGKSGSVESLYRYLIDRGFKTKAIEWNSNRLIRNIVQKIHSVNLLTPFIYSILQWISFLLDYFFKIRPALNKNYILIADRYLYTGYTRDIANGASKIIGNRLKESIRKPDLIFFYDVDVQVCYERIEKRGKTLFRPNKKLQGNEALKNENIEYLINLKQEYLNLFQSSVLAKETNIIYLRVSDQFLDMQIRNNVEAYIGQKAEKGLFVDKTVISKLS